MNKRTHKDTLYEQVARIGKATSSPKRLELLELLAQGEKSVEVLAIELSIEIKLASAHLKVLRDARLVSARKDGKYVFYRLSGNDVASLWVKLREVAENHLAELHLALSSMVAAPDILKHIDRQQLMKQAQRGEIIIIDVRPREEFDTAHLPYARSMPLNEIAQRLSDLPKNRKIVAYCRGPFCLFADEAAALLKQHGHQVCKLMDGVSEWQAAGYTVQTPNVNEPLLSSITYR
jgi:rhodanese-related sulfurtransferase/DNA-binding transcriptional ArsR family regulator